ncbi:hypothetical protein [Cellulomonas composti]|nr:hypothetical protein [Cellulomonas composti]
MGHLWQIVQKHLDEYGVREAALARKMGTRPQTLNSWKNRGLKQLPERRLLDSLAVATRTPYETVLEAALADTEYRSLDAGSTFADPAYMPEDTLMVQWIEARRAERRAVAEYARRHGIEDPTAAREAMVAYFHAPSLDYLEREWDARMDAEAVTDLGEQRTDEELDQAVERRRQDDARRPDLP